MRVLQIGKYYPPDKGGIETFTRQVAGFLATQKIPSRVLVFGNTQATGTERSDGIEVVRAGSFAKIASQPLSVRYVREIVRAPEDVFALHAPNPLAMLAVLAAGRAADCVVHYHSDIVRQRTLAKPVSALIRYFLAKAHRIVVATPRHIEFSDVLPRFAKKCAVVHFGVAPTDFAPPERPCLPRGVPAPDGFFMFAGRLVYYKGLRVFLAAVAAAGVTAVIVGDGPERNALERMAGDLGLKDRVFFPGEVSRPELLTLYRRARAFVLPSIHKSEAFGIVQLEAMASRLPVISTDLPSGVPYVNKDGESGLVVRPGDAAALAGAIGRLRDDDVLREKLATGAYRRVTRHFSEEVMFGKLLEIYRDCFENRRHRQNVVRREA